MSPRDMVADSTARWVDEKLSKNTAHILDVGCGDGRVAQALMGRGHRVTGIDVLPDRIAEAVARGVDASVCSAREVGGGPFDAVLFAYSLHHVRDPAQVLAHIKTLMRPGGTLLVREMAFDQLREPTLEWTRAMERLLVATGAVDDVGYAWFARPGGAHEHHHGHHGEHHHGDHHEGPGPGHPHHEMTHSAHDDELGAEEFTQGDVMKATIEALFGPVKEERGPVIHAFWSDGLGADGGAVHEALAELERSAVDAGAIDPLLRCWVARNGSAT